MRNEQKSRLKAGNNFLKAYKRGLKLYNTKDWPDLSNEWERDYEALRGDWENVGNSITRAAKDVRRKNRYAGSFASWRG